MTGGRPGPEVPPESSERAHSPVSARVDDMRLTAACRRTRFTYIMTMSNSPLIRDMQMFDADRGQSVGRALP